MKFIGIHLIRFVGLKSIVIYQKCISPLMMARCRYYPTCSKYAYIALYHHTPKHAIKLTLKRLLSCHPFGGSGVDFVPVPLYQYYYCIAQYQHPYIQKDRYSYVCKQNRLHR